MLETHCHVVPAVDDGAQTLDEGLEMLARMHAGGIREVVATPHWLHPQFDADAARIDAAYASLEEAARARFGDQLRLHLGAENHFSGLLRDADFVAEVRPFGSSSVVLVELPDHRVPSGFWSSVFCLRTAGYRPIIAHVERCRPLFGQHLEFLTRFVENGGLIQVTLGALLGKHGVSAWLRARRIFKRYGDHCLVVSDAHNLGLRKPLWTAASKAIRAHQALELSALQETGRIRAGG